MNPFFQLSQYISYLFKARDQHSLHSPFAFEFYTEIIRSKKKYPEFDPIEQLRKKLKGDSREIEIYDLGAGSGINSSNKRTIASICQHSEKRAYLAQLLYRIIQRQNPATILDLGTSLGLTTAYLASAAPRAKVYTFEGCPNTASIASTNFQQLSLNNIELVVGNIDQTLPELLRKTPSIDFVFFDANHRYKPTIEYFHHCLTKATNESIFIFDDIYWSPEMKKAWSEIKKHPSVGMSMDLFFLGIIFFRKKQPIQHFILK